MPSSKRTPINYAPAFGGGIFRPKDEIEGDLALLDGDSVAARETPPLLPATPSEASQTSIAVERTNERSNERTKTAATERIRDQSDLRTNERTNECAPVKSLSNRTNGRTVERSNAVKSDLNAPSAMVEPMTDRSVERTNERFRVRHSFDIFRDQLVSLGDIQIARHRESGRKPKLGDLVQEALDAYIEHHERTNERSR